MDRQKIEGMAAAAIMRLPEALMRTVCGPVKSVGSYSLETQSQFLLELQARSGKPGFGELDVAETREAFGGMTGGLGAGVRAIEHVVDRAIPGPGGDIPVRIYTPFASASNAPALVYFHGGGWVIGDISSHDEVCRALAEEVQCVVINVDYRLAPEHKFPAAADDALTAYRWVFEHAVELGVDPNRIAVGGDSAGGNLAAVVSQDTKAEPNSPCFQLLIYPVTDLRCGSDSYEQCADGFFLTRQAMHWFRDHYLSEEAERENPRVSPLLAEDFGGLAPAFVATAGFDPLRDEGRAYAEKLAAAGGVVSYRCYEGTIHGCLSLSGVLPSGGQMLADAVGALRCGFSRIEG